MVFQDPVTYPNERGVQHLCKSCMVLHQIDQKSEIKTIIQYITEDFKVSFTELIDLNHMQKSVGNQEILYAIYIDVIPLDLGSVAYLYHVIWQGTNYYVHSPMYVLFTCYHAQVLRIFDCSIRVYQSAFSGLPKIIDSYDWQGTRHATARHRPCCRYATAQDHTRVCYYGQSFIWYPIHSSNTWHESSNIKKYTTVILGVGECLITITVRELNQMIAPNIWSLFTRKINKRLLLAKPFV